MSEQALITLGLLQDHDTLLKGYVDEKYKEFAQGYDYYSSTNNVSMTTDTLDSGTVTRYTESITDTTGEIASKVTRVAAKGNYIVEKITIGAAAPKYRKWLINKKTGQINCTWSDTEFEIPESRLYNTSWETVIECANAGLGEYIWTDDATSWTDIIDDGTGQLYQQSTTGRITVDIVGFNHDELESGEKANITFAMRHLLANSYYMQSPPRNDGGFIQTDMCQFLNDDVFNVLPEIVRNAIKPVKKNTSTTIGNPYSIQADVVKLFLFSEVELYGTTSQSYIGEGTRYNGFTSPYYTAYFDKRFDNGNSYNAAWWTRSPCKSDDGYLVAAAAVEGSAGEIEYSLWSADASNPAFGICFGFCI